MMSATAPETVTGQQEENLSLLRSFPEAYSVHLDTFDGPLDLLLHLIKKNELDICDIPIAVITRQYLDYIKLMKELNLEVAGDFLLMASTLLHIKSRMLLPQLEPEEGRPRRSIRGPSWYAACWSTSSIRRRAK